VGGYLALLALAHSVDHEQVSAINFLSFLGCAIYKSKVPTLCPQELQSLYMKNEIQPLVIISLWAGREICLIVFGLYRMTIW
jgi:hypothetical protein